MSGKLTKARLRLLQAAASKTLAHRPSYPPIKALRDAGLIEFDGPAGNGLWWIDITEAGRQALTKGGRT